MTAMGARDGGVIKQLPGIKFIGLPTAPPDDEFADQLYDLADEEEGSGLLLKDKSGIQHPVVPCADGAGVVQIEHSDSPFQLLPHHRKVLVDTSGGTVTALLPAGTDLQRGTSIEFVDQARSFGTNALTIDGGAADINGAGTLVRSVNDAGVTLTWGGVTWEHPTAASGGVADLPANIVKKYSAAGRNGAGAITLTGTKVGDKVIGALGFVTATGALASAAPEASFESTITVADQIQQSSASNLTANTYVFFIQPRS